MWQYHENWDLVCQSDSSEQSDQVRESFGRVLGHEEACIPQVLTDNCHNFILGHVNVFATSCEGSILRHLPTCLTFSPTETILQKLQSTWQNSLTGDNNNKKSTSPLFPQYFKASTGDGRRWEANKNRPQYGGERWRGENNKKSSFLPLLVKEDEISPPPPGQKQC